MAERQWWEPELADAAYVVRLRDDYPEKCEGMSDERVRDHFNDTGGKYVVTWDHLGDAYAQFEALADAYLALRAQVPQPEERSASSASGDSYGG